MKNLEDQAQKVFRVFSRAIWDVACMTIHPEVFDYPAENGGRVVRKTAPTAIAPSRPPRPPSFEEALPLVVAAFYSVDHWLDMFSKTKLPPEEVFDSDGTSAGHSECAEDPLS
jgi:hypothetical protein